MTHRIEKDALGSMEIPVSAYYGIYTQRALLNFPLSPAHTSLDLVRAHILIKKAAAHVNAELKLITAEKGLAIAKACDLLLNNQFQIDQVPLSEVDFAQQFPTHPLQGGAGTSTNMNVNEVIANVAIEIMGGQKGDYTLVHPINDVNCSQSTNDVYPTAMRIAAIHKIRSLADALAKLQEALQHKESEFANVLKLGRTQLMDALPITLGQEFGAYGRAISRDRWRIYKVEERLREVNIGGTAVGTGLNAPLAYTYRMTDMLQRLTGLGISRSDLLIDTTQNNDVFVEVSGFLKSCAVNLIKIANDLRLMASGPIGGFGEIELLPLQAGSSIMPGKVNPVMCEMMVQVGFTVIGNDSKITNAAFSGQLELNAFSPLIIESLLESLNLLTTGVTQFRILCVEPLKANAEHCLELVQKSSALAAALIDYIGYDVASALAKEAQTRKITIEALIVEKGLFTPEKAKEILNVHQVTKPGIPGKR